MLTITWVELPFKPRLVLLDPGTELALIRLFEETDKVDCLSDPFLKGETDKRQESLLFLVDSRDEEEDDGEVEDFDENDLVWSMDDLVNLLVVVSTPIFRQVSANNANGLLPSSYCEN